MEPAATLRDLRRQALEAAEALGRLEPGEVDAAAVELIAEAERLKNSLCAVQAQAAVTLKQARIAERAHQPKPMRERGIGTEVALARRESPHRGGIHLGLAVVLTEELPHTLAAMRAGWCTQWRATQIAQGTACLSLVDRLRIDAELMSQESTTAGWGERRFRAEVDRLAYVADPAAAVARHEKAVSERHTSIRPVADGMVRLSALLPLAKGVSVHATLSRCADSARAAGDERTRGQVMADTLVEGVLGDAEVVPVTVQVTLSDAALLNLPGRDGDEPGWVGAPGTGAIPLPADLVRDLVRRASEQGVAELKRLYLDRGGRLVAMESTARTFPAGLADLLTTRDRTCRTPGCDAPVRHHDHVRPHAEGGPTSADNGQGLCEGCNYAKQAPGWSSRPLPGDPTVVETITPSGYRHLSRAPGLPPPQQHRLRLDLAFAQLGLAA